MKKLFFLGALFAVGLGFTACSDKDVAENNGPEEIGTNSYLAVSINLPQSAAETTRETPDNNEGVVDLNDGLAKEYAVKNATLLIFDASDNFVEAHTLSINEWTTSSDPHVTQKPTAKIVQPVSNTIQAGYKMLVILNHHDLIEVTNTNGLKVSNGGAALAAFAVGSSYTTLQAMTATSASLSSTAMSADIDTKGIFMANAPLADVQGSTTTEPSTATTNVLTPISAVYKNATDAAAGAADQIYVERGVAKVTMTQGGDYTLNLSSAKDKENNDVKWKVTGWLLDNTNTTSYLIRSDADYNTFRSLKSNAPSPANVYRMIGNLNITEGTPSPYKYRTYFAKSPAYDSDATLTKRSSETFLTTFGDMNPLYCLENTFNVAHQTVNHTTLVQVEVTAKVGEGSPTNLYTKGLNRSTIYTQAHLNTEVGNAVVAYFTTNPSEVTGTVKASDISVEFTTDASKTVTSISKITYSGTATFAEGVYDGTNGFKDDIKTAAYTALGSGTPAITLYEGGKSYYSIRIKHFGDRLTPWRTWEAAAGKTAPKGADIANIYPDNDSNQDGDYLGRYGVLRNNWYDISVNSIRYLGNPVPHSGEWPGTPDDELDSYITFSINILSWAKRTQAADL